MKYTPTTYRLLCSVKRANKLPLETKRKRLQFWRNRSKHLFTQGYFDLAYEYIAMLELNLYLDLDKSDPFRLKVWKMFVIDFRRAYSDYEFEKLQHFMELYN